MLVQYPIQKVDPVRILCLLAAPSPSPSPSLSRSPSTEASRDAALFDLASLFSPWVEVTDGAALFEIDDLSRLFPTEPRLLAAIEQAARKLALPVHVGVADDRYTALIAALAARLGEAERVAPGGAAAYLARQPIARLPPQLASAETRRMLARWGVQQLGELANLPPGGVTLRLGAEGALLAAIARGEATAPLVPRPPPVELAESGELEWGLYEVEPFLFAVQQSLGQLQRRLALRALAARALVVTLRLDLSSAPPGTEPQTTRRVELAAPTRDLATWQVLLRLQLEAAPPAAPIVGFTIVAEPDRVRPRQLGLWEPVGPSPEKLATAIGRIAALVGRDRIGVPLPVESHHPEATAMAPAESLLRSQSAGSGPIVNVDVNGQRYAALRPLALHLFRPCRAAQVGCDRNALRFVRAEGITGQVYKQSGPFFVRDAWWDATRAIERSYYDVELSDGGVYRLFEDARGWHIAGVYE